MTDPIQAVIERVEEALDECHGDTCSGDTCPTVIAIRSLAATCIEKAASILDGWAQSTSCDPPGACTHMIMGDAAAKRIRALLPESRGVKP